MSHTHVVRCVLPTPSHRLTFWWFDEFQRDSGRVYGTAESGISSASFKVLHLPTDFSPDYPRSFLYFIFIFYIFFRHFLQLFLIMHKTSLHNCAALITSVRTLYVFCRCLVKRLDWTLEILSSGLLCWLLTDVSLSPPCHPPLELSVESKFGQLVYYIYIYCVWIWSV